MINLKAVLEERGLTVVGPVTPGIGNDGGYIVKAPLTHPEVKKLGERWNVTPTGPNNTIVWPKGEIEGRHRCGYCMRQVGSRTDRFGTYVLPYRTYTREDHSTGYLCFDTDRCHQSVKEADAFGAAEAKAYFPEQEDEDEDDLNDVGEVVE